MRVTIRGLRQWIVGAAALLLAVVAGFFIYGRNRFRHIEKDLPGRLGINVSQTANNITFSQATQGHTLFTLKASKQVQMKSGHVLLHDVDITLYGPPGSGRTDRIFGSDFDYDQTHGIIVSQGDVNIELQGTNGPAPANGSGAAGDPDSNAIRVKTRGLTFVQKTGEATTAQAVEFQLPRAAGVAVGADYNSKTGVVVLNSQVHITTSTNGKAAVVDAARATLLRATDQALLVSATVNYEEEEASSDQATVFFRKDGTAEKIDAQGHVRMKTDTGADINAQTAQILMDEKNQPTQADLGGGVQFASSRENETMHGAANNGTLLFATMNGASGTETSLRHGEFRQDVNFDEEVAGLAKDPHGHAQKLMHAEKVDVDFAPQRPGQSLQARSAIAQGNPVLTSKQMPSKGPEQTTKITGDRLVATLGEANAMRQLDSAGNTRIVQSSTDGSHSTTNGDRLHASFVQEPAPVKTNPGTRPPAKSGPTRSGNKNQKQQGPRMQTTLETATQDGNVVMTETPAKKAGATTEPPTLTGWAQHAEYHGTDEVLHLTGSPRISDGESMQVAADRIDYHRDTQNAAASGHVKATYTQPPKGASPATTPPPTMGGSGPVHVIADHATLDHAKNQNFFYGTTQAPARMWQDPDSLLAPVIEIDRTQNLLKARGEDTGSAPVVNANFTSALGGNHQQSVVRVHSQTLIYSDKTRQGDFHGTVTAEQGDEAIHADDALLFLKPATAKSGQPPPKPAAANPAPGPAGKNSQLDHMIATGNVLFTQPGRKGSGDKLIYTADDGKYVLTGTDAALPQMWDRVHGTTTGAALIFNSQDDSVVVSGGKSSAVTETRAKQ
ncbi:MAG TPA: LptA/OstA family protein [Acidobacteriaceae bacterium]|jgi:lipopolysaccharide export system protein LptA|nr:LptA/OstA family protein [Acidobacteriaceae bacterium]